MNIHATHPAGDGTSAALTIENEHPLASVSIGPASVTIDGSPSTILGRIDIDSDASAVTQDEPINLTIDASADSTGQNVSLDAATVDGHPGDSLTGMTAASAPILVQDGMLDSLTLKDGTGHNTFTITDTPDDGTLTIPTTLDIVLGPTSSTCKRSAAFWS